MGKPFPSAIHLQDFARITSKQFSGPKFSKPRSKNQFFPEFLKSGGGDSDRAIRKMEGSERNRMPLSAVVSDCVKRWFQDTLKEARAGDTAMQVLVGQMYFSGYGIPRDEKKVIDNSGFSISSIICIAVWVELGLLIVLCTDLVILLLSS